jgi:hypothetical protein
MNTAVIIRFLTPYISSITRDQDFVHSPLPLDGALAHALYWEALVAGDVPDSPTQGQADRVLMQNRILPALDSVMASVSLGDRSLLDDRTIIDRVYSVSSGFPVLDGKLYIKQGAHWMNPDTGDRWVPKHELQPIRKRVPIDRLSSLGLAFVGERGTLRLGEVETGKGVLKPIDNRVNTWQVFEYVWFAEVLDRERLRTLLGVLKYEGVGKKRSAGFGKVLDFQVEDIAARFPSLRISRRLFAEHNGDDVLLRPLPYDAIMLAPAKVVMTNLMVESGCGYRPPYWSDRRVVVREGTIFRFLN